MICYADKTFCSFYKECKNPCARALTEAIIERATIWSKQYHPTDLLICQFIDKPECFKDK